MPVEPSAKKKITTYQVLFKVEYWVPRHWSQRPCGKEGWARWKFHSYSLDSAKRIEADAKHYWPQIKTCIVAMR